MTLINKLQLKFLIVALIFITLFFFLSKTVNAQKGANYFLASFTQTTYDDSTGMSSAEVNDVIQSEDGYIWIATYGGLIRYDGNSFVSLTSTQSNKFPQISAMALCEDKEHNLWIATNSNGIYILSKKNNITTINKDSGLLSNSVRKIVCSNDGTIYVGTTNGICKIDKNHNVSAFKETKNLYISDMICTTSGNVYAVTSDGDFITVSSKGKVVIQVFDYDFSCIRSISDTQFQIGTFSDKIIDLKIENGNTKISPHTIKDLSGMSKIYTDKDGKAWIVSATGLGILKDDYSVEVISKLSVSTNLTSMIQDFDGNYWIASNKRGLLKLINSRFSNFSFEYNIPEATVNAIVKYNGDFYIGTDTGLQIVSSGKPINNTLTKLFEGVRIRCIYVDSKNDLWVCTYKLGLELVKISSDGNYSCITKKEGLVNENVRNITEISGGRYVVGTADGVSIIKEGKIIKNYTKTDGLTNTSVLATCEDEKGIIYIASDGAGIFTINGDKIDVIDESNGLSGGVILRLIYDKKNNCIWASTSNSLIVIKDGKIKTINASKNFNSIFDIIIKDDNTICILTSCVIYVSSFEELMKDDETTKIYSISKKLGLNSSITSNSWNWLDNDGTLYLSCIKGINSINTNYKKSFIPRILISSVKTDNQIYYGEDNFEIPSNNNRLTINLSILKYIPSDGVKIEYYLEGQDNNKTIVNSNDLSQISYTNLRGGSYKFHLNVINEDGAYQSEQILLNFNKEKGFFEKLPIIIVLVVISIMCVFLITFYIFKTKSKVIAKRQCELRSILDQAISAIINAIDAKDSYTKGHSVRVANYSIKIGKHLNMSEDELENLYYIAILHDVGKIGIPDTILNKPGHLTDEEFDKMKQHTTIGNDILKDISAIDGVSLGASQHHEKWDGTGYGEGLSGENISLASRIICVADSFDTMATNRAYRDRLSKDTILKELNSCCGTQFDPTIGGIMINMIISGELDEAFS